ncbi:hypothetical protein FQN54_001961 [Arachnomyces sp. PD_36]|nr:hypothetical protein FQN54_001961 [Arachnomyces sp. PD_36]
MNPYKVLQNEYSDLLHKIDSYRSSINRQKAATFIKSLIPEYAHQSVQIENNRLLLSEALHIAKLLDPYLQTLNLSSLPSSNLPSLPLPPAHELLPSQPPSQVSELRNHLIASHWVTTQALQSPQINPLLSEPQTRHLTALLTRDTPSEHLHSTSWGGRTTPGSYRKTPIRTRSNPLCIFPYHTEVPNLMHQFFTWRDTANADLHPLLLACQMVVYFTSIHPFLDGNGPVRRVLMQDNLMRRGYFPVVMRGLGDGEYGGLLSDCQDGDGRGVEGFVGRVLWGELDAMRDCALLGRG